MAIPGFSVASALDQASLTIQGAVNTFTPNGAAEAVGTAVRGRLSEATQGLVSRVDGAVGGTQNRQALERLIQGDVSGAIDTFTGNTVAGSRTIEEAITSALISGKIGGNPNERNGSLTAWGGLSRHLIGNLYACDSKGIIDTAQGVVAGPVSDITFEASFNWQSPFENAGPESKAPALMALIQTGQIGTVANALQAAFPNVNAALGDPASTLASAAKDLEGKTGITKLNSRQVFSGMPPIKIPLTMHFRAVTNARSEVLEPYQRLLEWAMPQELAKDGVLPAVIGSGSLADLIKALFPSKAPQMVAFEYAKQKFAPLVIESVSTPLDGPKGDDGLPLYYAVQIQLSTLTALDRADIKGLFIR